MLMLEISIGANQFAYCHGRGARDAVAYLLLSWLKCFQEKARIALYMSDVSAAFDRVFAERLIAKLKARKVPPDLLRLFAHRGLGRSGQKWLSMAASRRCFG